MLDKRWTKTIKPFPNGTHLKYYHHKHLTLTFVSIQLPTDLRIAVQLQLSWPTVVWTKHTGLVHPKCRLKVCFTFIEVSKYFFGIKCYPVSKILQRGGESWRRVDGA